MSAVVTSRRIIAVYLGTNVLFTLATSIIWGVNTLFLMRAGFDIFEVLVINATFTAGQVLFEIPTGVIADTIGRRASFLIGIVALLFSTLWYVGGAIYDWGIWSFVGASVLIGFGFTCQTGAVEAWLVDALDDTGYDLPKERVFAWGGMSFGVAMLVGTLFGGVLGQIDLTWPYIARATILLITLVVTALLMRDIGFEPRRLRLSTFAEETRSIARAGITYGWRHPVVRPLMFVSLVSGVFFLYAFYAWQRYALDLLGEELVWVSAVLVAGFSAAGIGGNLLVRPVMRTGSLRREPGRVLAVLMGIGAVVTAGMAFVGLAGFEPGIGPLAAASALWLVFGVIFGLLQPIRQAFINEQIPSAQRATVLSFDSFFSEGGGMIGQPGLGWIARAVSIPAAYLVGSVFLAAAVPVYRRAATAARGIGGGGLPNDDGAEGRSGAPSATHD
ncbi:MAG: MFS transporter [Coriobacteriia bacterium]|nr:MFS transporter [Coriobacteriia bacterium]